MPGLVSLKLNPPELTGISKKMAASQKDIELALRRTINKTTRWVMTHLARELAKETGLPVTLLRRRLKRYIDKNTNSAKIWLGLSPVPISHLSPRQNALGVKAAHHFFKGAFITNRHGKSQVFKRKTKNRLPIVKPSISIDTASDPVIELTIYPQINQRFTQLFEQELRWLTR